MKEIENKIDKIDKKLDKILLILENSIELNCNRMGNHINFIENVYENIKFPLIYFCSIFNNLLLNSDNEINLPRIDNQPVSNNL